MERKSYKISFIGCGNLAYRLSMALKSSGHHVEYIFGRDANEAQKLTYILNKPESVNNSPFLTSSTENLSDLFKSQIVILAVNDNSIIDVADGLKSIGSDFTKTTILHCSGATDISPLKSFVNHGVLYPLMTLSKTKPVDFSIVPFFIEHSNKKVQDELTNICYSLNSEYREVDSKSRLKIHLAAVYVSNFVNYITGLAFDLSKPNHMFLMPLAIETIRKAFLYEHPSLVQTGPAIRGDGETIEKHLSLLIDNSPHKEVYKLITEYIKQKK